MMSRFCACGCGSEVSATFKKGHNRRRSAEERFWEKVYVNDCWHWTGAMHEAGYGRFNDGNRVVAAHRWAYESLVGPIPVGLHVDHICRNPGCVNPDHLEPVTPAENAKRGYGATAMRHRHPERYRLPNAPSKSIEYRRDKEAEYMADAANRARKMQLQRERRSRQRALLNGVRP